QGQVMFLAHSASMVCAACALASLTEAGRSLKIRAPRIKKRDIRARPRDFSHDEPQFLIDTAAIRNRCNPLKMKDGAPF
ncbi:MAG: hypothetical protein WAJ86_18070, partial [Candidatus Acidiferrales bacterium]